MSAQFIEEDKNKTRLSLRALAMKLWPYMWQQKAWTLGALALVFLYAAAGRFLPFLFGYAVDEGIKKANLKLVYIAAGIFLIVELIRAGVGLYQTYLMEKLGNRVMFKIREKLLAHVQALPVSYFDKNPTGRIVTRVTHDVLSLGELFNQGFTAIFVNIFELTTIIVSMLVISPSLTVVTLVVAPIALWLAARISRRLRGHFAESKKRMAQLATFTTESLGGMRVLKLFHRTAHRTAGFEKLSGEYRAAQVAAVRELASLWPLLAFFNVATVASSLLFAAYLNQGEKPLSVGELTTFVLLVQGFYSPIRVIIERYNQFQNSLAGADRIFTLFEESTEVRSGTRTGPLKGEIAFDHVNFRYNESLPLALHDVSFSIQPGESVALVGRTGSGKTTITSLLQKYYPVTDGRIRVDGLNLQDLDTREYRRRIGIVSQDPFLFRGTVEENLTLCDPSVGTAAVLRAIQICGLEKFIEKIGGLSGKIEERGQNLSVGERQLLAFARALAFNPDLLILDEATANIDSQNEVLLKQATQTATKGRTSLIIAHRLSTVVHCDRILVLQNGRLVEEGRHKDLMANGGVYAELYQHGFE